VSDQPHELSTTPQYRHGCAITLLVLLFVTQSLAQQETTDFKVDVNSAFVWGNDSPGGAVSSTLEDPLTGRSLPKLSYGGIEVTSRMGFERVGGGRVGEYLEQTTTIVNDSGVSVSLQYGGRSVDGYVTPPPLLVANPKKTARKERADATKTVSLRVLSCFRNGFLASESFFSAGTLSESLSIAPRTALTISSLVKDPRNYSVRCSIEGCHPTGTIRYYLRIGGHDFVFVWPGRSVAYCGK